MARLNITRLCREPSAQQIEHWIRRAKPGQYLQYHEGLLCDDRIPRPFDSPNQTSNAERVNGIADMLWLACELEVVRLFSVRLDEGFYRYLAQRTYQPVRKERLA